jgi:hypothetical protein
MAGFWTVLHQPGLSIGAGGRGRTGMPSQALDFESSASTNFTTPAIFSVIITEAHADVKDELAKDWRLQGDELNVLTPIIPFAIKVTLKGAVAQLGERLNGIQEVVSSILISSTMYAIGSAYFRRPFFMLRISTTAHP